MNMIRRRGILVDVSLAMNQSRPVMPPTRRRISYAHQKRQGGERQTSHHASGMHVERTVNCVHARSNHVDSDHVETYTPMNEPTWTEMKRQGNARFLHSEYGHHDYSATLGPGEAPQYAPQGQDVTGYRFGNETTAHTSSAASSDMKRQGIARFSSNARVYRDRPSALDAHSSNSMERHRTGRPPNKVSLHSYYSSSPEPYERPRVFTQAYRDGRRDIPEPTVGREEHPSTQSHASINRESPMVPRLPNTTPRPCNYSAPSEAFEHYQFVSEAYDEDILDFPGCDFDPEGNMSAQLPSYLRREGQGIARFLKQSSLHQNNRQIMEQYVESQFASQACDAETLDIVGCALDGEVCLPRDHQTNLCQNLPPIVTPQQTSQLDSRRCPLDFDNTQSHIEMNRPTKPEASAKDLHLGIARFQSKASSYPKDPAAMEA